jgi:transcriptional antiterminator NusG
VLAKLQMSDDVYHLIKNTPKVTGFLGSMGKPQAISEAEAARILNTKEENATAAPKTKVSVDYDIGDQVKVTSGNFASFTGVVESSISIGAASRFRFPSSAAQRRSNLASRTSSG